MRYYTRVNSARRLQATDRIAELMTASEIQPRPLGTGATAPRVLSLTLESPWRCLPGEARKTCIRIQTTSGSDIRMSMRRSPKPASGPRRATGCSLGSRPDRRLDLGWQVGGYSGEFLRAAFCTFGWLGFVSQHRYQASRTLRVASRWPAATLDPWHRCWWRALERGRQKKRWHCNYQSGRSWW
jgi:hypothetical protein